MENEKFEELYRSEGWEEIDEGLLVEEFWRPEPGDELIGFYTGRAEVTSSFTGEKQAIIMIKTEEGMIGVNENIFLQRRLDSAKIKEGDGIRIRYLGKRRTLDKKREYNAYDVQIKRMGTS